MSVGVTDFDQLERWSVELDELKTYLARVPAVTVLSGAIEQRERWWVKLAIDIDHPNAWQVVQELGFVLNYISLNERLPTVFMPVSPPPYLNGGPRDFLSWVIDSREPVSPFFI